MYMTATVKSFILNNLTDQNFEKLVNMLIVDKIYLYGLDELEFLEDYLNGQTPSYSQEETYEILNEIKKVTPSQAANYKNELLMDGIEELNNLSMEWMPATASTAVHTTIKNFSSDYETPKEDFEYTSIHEVKTPLINNPDDDYEEELFDINKENYTDILEREKDHTALALANFVYEVIYFTNDSKPEIDTGELTSEVSLVKITEDPEYTSGYVIQFLLDNKSRYLTAEQLERYRDHYDIYRYTPAAPEFVKYQAIVDDVQPFVGEYILAPFTFYLNEQLNVPKLSDEESLDVVEQLVHVLTLQGFTKEEQVSTIKYAYREYLNLHML